MPNASSWKRGNIKIVNLADRASLDVNKIEFWEELQPSETEANEKYRHKKRGKNSPDAGEQHSDQKFGMDTSLWSVPSLIYCVNNAVVVSLTGMIDGHILSACPAIVPALTSEREGKGKVVLFFFKKRKFYMSLPLCAVNALSVFWKPVPTSSLFPFMRQSRFPLAITCHSHACM